MKLDQFEYISNRGNPNEWRIDGCQLGNINLIVGKNASGKSRIVKSIYKLSELLSESEKIDQLFRKRTWHLFFDRTTNCETEYFLELENGEVLQERLIIGSQQLLERNESGEGKIFAQELNQYIRFQTPKTELAVVKRRDTIQHPFLEDIYKWSSSLRFYEFGTQLGKYTLAKLPPTTELLKAKTDTKDSDYVVEIFVLGKREHHNAFTQRIIDDMNGIGYQIAKIETKVPSFFKSNISPPENLDEDSDNLPKFLYVQEDGLKSVTEQSEISQGMFRALSLFIQINYAILSDQPSCIIIDDIGEGLDFQRSSAIIKLLIEKAKTGLVQLIMTTNDENIMNGVPLEYWSVIERQPGVAKLHNYANSPEQFEQFKHIGLNNFDFFASEYYLQEPNSEEVID